MLLTYKSIPMQVDGEPCRLAPAMIRISLRNQANMVQKSKRRTSMPLLNEWVCSWPTLLNTKTLERRVQSMCMVWEPHCVGKRKKVRETQQFLGFSHGNIQSFFPLFIVQFHTLLLVVITVHEIDDSSSLTTWECIYWDSQKIIERDSRVVNCVQVNVFLFCFRETHS